MSLHKFMQIAGIQDEETFYKKYPSDEAFFKKFPKFKAANGINLKDLTQTPDYMDSQNLGTTNPVQQPNYGAVGPVVDNSGMGSSVGTVQPVQGNNQTPWYKQDSWTTDAQSITAMNPLMKKNWNPAGGVNTNDLFTGTTALIAGALPYTKPNQNQPILPQAINPNANGIAGSRATYAKGGAIHINPVNKGKFNATKKATGKSTEELTHSSNPVTKKRAVFAQNAKKWHHGKAEDGAELNRDNWNALQDYTARNAPNYGGDQYNHGQFANGILQAFNQANPNQAIQPQDIQRYQQDMINNPQAIAGAQGFSGTDNKFGAKTMQQSYKNYQVVHQDGRGKTLSDDYFGTNSNAAAQKLASFNQPRQWQSNDQGIPMNASQDQVQPAMASVHGVGHQVPQKSNWHTNENIDYSIDSVRDNYMANGGMVPAGNYEQGQEYDLPLHVIKILEKQGYKLEY